MCEKRGQHCPVPPKFLKLSQGLSLSFCRPFDADEDTDPKTISLLS